MAFHFIAIEIKENMKTTMLLTVRCKTEACFSFFLRSAFRHFSLVQLFKSLLQVALINCSWPAPALIFFFFWHSIVLKCILLRLQQVKKQNAVYQLCCWRSTSFSSAICVYFSFQTHSPARVQLLKCRPPPREPQ